MNGILCAELRSVRSLVSHCLALHGVHAAHSASSELCNQQQQSIADSQQLGYHSSSFARTCPLLGGCPANPGGVCKNPQKSGVLG